MHVQCRMGIGLNLISQVTIFDESKQFHLYCAAGASWANVCANKSKYFSLFSGLVQFTIKPFISIFTYSYISICQRKTTNVFQRNSYRPNVTLDKSTSRI